MNGIDNLPQLADLPGVPVADLRDLPKLPHVAHLDEAVRETLTSAQAAGDRILRRRAAGRQFLDARQSPSVAALIERLPAPGETFHVVSGATGWHYFGFIPAVLQLADGATIDRLSLATLGFSEESTDRLCNLIDAGKVTTAELVVSAYFRSVDKPIYSDLVTRLQARGGRVVVARNHCKLILFALSDGRRLCLAGSANLRSNKNNEQADLTNDPDLYGFYLQFISDTFAAGNVR